MPTTKNNSQESNSLSRFQTLCNIALGVTDYALAVALDNAILATSQGKNCIELISKYNQGLVTFAEFQSVFVFQCFLSDKKD